VGPDWLGSDAPRYDDSWGFLLELSPSPRGMGKKEKAPAQRYLRSRAAFLNLLLQSLPEGAARGGVPYAQRKKHDPDVRCGEWGERSVGSGPNIQGADWRPMAVAPAIAGPVWRKASERMQFMPGGGGGAARGLIRRDRRALTRSIRKAIADALDGCLLARGQENASRRSFFRTNDNIQTLRARGADGPVPTWDYLKGRGRANQTQGVFRTQAGYRAQSLETVDWPAIRAFRRIHSILHPHEEGSSLRRRGSGRFPMPAARWERQGAGRARPSSFHMGRFHIY